jgi:hypothetical protein
MLGAGGAAQARQENGLPNGVSDTGVYRAVRVGPCRGPGHAGLEQTTCSLTCDRHDLIRVQCSAADDDDAAEGFTCE